MSEPRERYRLTLQALPSQVPANNRLRRALKALLRSYGFRCLCVEDLPAERPAESKVKLEDQNSEDPQPAA